MYIIKGNVTTYKYDGASSSFKSSLLIFAGVLQLNEIYQFMVQMTNRQNSTLKMNGYVLVQIQAESCPMIVIS